MSGTSPGTGGPFGADPVAWVVVPTVPRMTDLLSERCGDLLTGSYDCPDRIVLNAYYSMGMRRAASGCGGGVGTTTAMRSWTTRT